MRILVTGGAGFIASHIADAYINAQHTVAVVDDLSTGRRENVPPKAQFFEADIRNSNALRKVFEDFNPDVVNHHAAQASVPRSSQNPQYDASVNIIGSLNLLSLSVEFGVKRFIYASTGGAVYGEPQQLPVDEDHPLMPTSPYGISKMVVEHYLRFFGKEQGLSWVALRYGNVYGPRQDPTKGAGVIAIFAARMLRGERPVIYGDGSAERDYIYISDVVAANIAALKYGQGPLNIATGKPTSVMQIYEAVSAVLGWDKGFEKRPMRPGEVQRVSLSVTQAYKTLNWKPQVGLEEGVRRTVDWVRANINRF